MRAVTDAAIKPLFIILRRWPDDALSRFAEAFRTHWVSRFSAVFSLSSVSTSFSHRCPHSSPSLDLSSGPASSSSSSFALVVEGLSALVRELAETELELKKEFSYHPSLKKARDEVRKLQYFETENSSQTPLADLTSKR